jgi:hypothetical protein
MAMDGTYSLAALGNKKPFSAQQTLLQDYGLDFQ